MSGVEIGILSIVLVLIAIYCGMQIGVSLILVSFVSVAMLRSPEVASRLTAAAVNDVLNEYLFGVVPLFVLMGLLVSVSGVGRDMFDVFQWLLRRVKGGLGVATVAANAVFAAITGISIASASVFTKVAVPEMVRHGYNPKFSVGVVAGSSVLGMLIPPSLLMIIYGVLAEESVGRMFLAGVIPGIALAIAFSLMIVGMAHWFPASVGGNPESQTFDREETLFSALVKLIPTALLITLVLGGLYGGFFTPTEAGAVGALGALIVALARRSLDLRKFWRVLVETGHVSVSVLFLVITANLYSRMLALTGMPSALARAMETMGLGAYGFLTVYVAIVLALGCIIDSVSIMLIMLPIVLPIAKSFGMDLIWFGVVTVVAVEIGLITPPFGVSVYTVKAAINDKSITIKDIFEGSFPFVICMTLVLIVLILFPGLSTWLARAG